MKRRFALLNALSFDMIDIHSVGVKNRERICMRWLVESALSNLPLLDKLNTMVDRVVGKPAVVMCLAIKLDVAMLEHNPPEHTAKYTLEHTVLTFIFMYSLNYNVCLIPMSSSLDIWHHGKVVNHRHT
jgi:hypothetical protein